MWNSIINICFLLVTVVLISVTTTKGEYKFQSSAFFGYDVVFSEQSNPYFIFNEDMDTLYVITEDIPPFMEEGLNENFQKEVQNCCKVKIAYGLNNTEVSLEYVALMTNEYFQKTYLEKNMPNIVLNNYWFYSSIKTFEQIIPDININKTEKMKKIYNRLSNYIDIDTINKLFSDIARMDVIETDLNGNYENELLLITAGVYVGLHRYGDIKSYIFFNNKLTYVEAPSHYPTAGMNGGARLFYVKISNYKHLIIDIDIDYITEHTALIIHYFVHDSIYAKGSWDLTWANNALADDPENYKLKSVLYFGKVPEELIKELQKNFFNSEK